MAITTNREYIQAALGKFNVNSSEVDLVLVESSLNGDSALDITACKTAIHKALSAFLPLADVSESDYSLRWNVEGLKLWYNVLCKELGKTNALKPAIRNRSNHW